MGPTVTDWIQAGAAVLTMIAAIAAFFVAAKAPRLAAKFAEEYRQQTTAADDLQRFRMNIFQTLMRHRRELLTSDARAAINLVDVAFSDVAEVRNARRLFYEEADDDTHNNPDLLAERYYAMIEAVARAVGMGAAITGSDIRTGYLPQGAYKIEQAMLYDAEERLARKAMQQGGSIGG